MTTNATLIFADEVIELIYSLNTQKLTAYGNRFWHKYAGIFALLRDLNDVCHENLRTTKYHLMCPDFDSVPACVLPGRPSRKTKLSVGF